MQTSSQLVFADNQKIPLPVDSSVHVVELSNIIDLGIGGEIPNNGQRIALDLAGGNPQWIFGSADISDMTANSTLEFIIQTTDDAATSSSWKEIYKGSFYAVNKIVELGVAAMPKGNKRYLKLKVSFKCATNPAASKFITVNAGFGRQDTMVR